VFGHHRAIAQQRELRGVGGARPAARPGVGVHKSCSRQGPWLASGGRTTHVPGPREIRGGGCSAMVGRDILARDVGEIYFYK
jgi:hypothetical protein